MLVGTVVPVGELATAIGVEPGRLDVLLAGDAPVDAEMDIRLSRYFGMSEGMFPKLQNDHDLQEAWRRNGPALDRIDRRPA